MTPPGQEQDLEDLKASVNRIVGAMDTLLRRIPVRRPGHLSTMLLKVGIPGSPHPYREPSRTLVFLGSGVVCPGGPVLTPQN